MNLMLEMVTGGYDLIVIEDEMTPLGAGPVGSNYYLATTVFVAVCAIAIMLSAWALRRRRLKMRLVELIEKSGNESIKIPLSIIKIKDETKALEAELTASMFDEEFVSL